MSQGVLGVISTPKALYFALVEDGAVLDTSPQKVEVPDHLQSPASLDALATEMRRQLAPIRVPSAAILVPNEYGGAVKATTARVGAETVFRMVMNVMGVQVDLLNRKRARSLMGLSQKGLLDDLVKELLPAAVGKYWSEGRRLAAFAAMAADKGA